MSMGLCVCALHHVRKCLFNISVLFAIDDDDERRPHIMYRDVMGIEIKWSHEDS